MLTKITSLMIAILFLAACQGSLLENNYRMNHGIIGGDITPRIHPAYKSTVAFLVKQYEGYEVNCSGTLISEDLIITAAHCFTYPYPRQNLAIYFGAVLPRSKTETVFEIESWKIHPQYAFIAENGDIVPTQNNPLMKEQAVSTIHDLAIVKIKGKAPEQFKPVSLLSANSNLNIGDRLILGGYGIKSDEFQMKTEALRHTEITISEFWNTHLILNQTSNNGVCKGDSGGPAYITHPLHPEELVLVGATRGAHNRSENCRGEAEITSIQDNLDFILNTAPTLSSSPVEVIEL